MSLKTTAQQQLFHLSKRAKTSSSASSSSSCSDATATAPPTLRAGLSVWTPRHWTNAEPIETLRRILLEDGVAVVPDVIDAAAAGAFITGIKTVLASCNAQWAVKSASGTDGHGLQKYYGIASSSPCQAVRCAPGVLGVYRRLYGLPAAVEVKSVTSAAAAGGGGATTASLTPQKRPPSASAALAGSVDACALLSVHHVRRPKTKVGASNSRASALLGGSTLKPHVDIVADGPSAALTRTLPRCFPHVVQGSVACIDQIARAVPNAAPGAAWVAPPGFVAMKGSVQCDQPPLSTRTKADFYCLPPDELELHRVAERLAYVNIPARALVLWLSTTVHTSYRGDADAFAGAAPDALARAAQMVCYAPAQCRSALARARKEAIWDDATQRAARRDEMSAKEWKRLPKRGASTSHYPHKCVSAGPGHYSNRRDVTHPSHWRTHHGTLSATQAALL